jgi:putative restriction endonuclease
MVPRKTLIDHEHRAGRLWPVLVASAANSQLLTYGDCAVALGIHHRAVGHALSPIQQYCIHARMPILTAIVVAARNRKPGNGYLGSLDNSDLSSVFAWNWSELENPFSDASTILVQKLSDHLLRDSGLGMKQILTLSRGGQQRVFRNAVLTAYGFRCCVCEFSFVEALEAAHIIPWANERVELRVRIENGLSLCSNHHRLFDAGVLLIGDDYRVKYCDPDGRLGGYSAMDTASSIAFHDKPIQLPVSRKHWPLKELLKERGRL